LWFRIISDGHKNAEVAENRGDSEETLRVKKRILWFRIISGGHIKNAEAAESRGDSEETLRFSASSAFKDTDSDHKASTTTYKFVPPFVIIREGVTNFQVAVLESRNI